MVFFYFCYMENVNQVFGIRAIIEAIQSGIIIDKVFIQKDLNSDLMRELMRLIKLKNINFSYVPAEKLNKLSSKNHQGAVANI